MPIKITSSKTVESMVQDGTGTLHAEYVENWKQATSSKQSKSMFRLIVCTGLMLLIRPKLWLTAIRTWYRFLPNGWWHWPPKPWMSSKLWKFRMVTAYADESAIPTASDTIQVLYFSKDK